MPGVAPSSRNGSSGTAVQGDGNINISFNAIHWWLCLEYIRIHDKVS